MLPTERFCLAFQTPGCSILNLGESKSCDDRFHFRGHCDDGRVAAAFPPFSLCPDYFSRPAAHCTKFADFL